MRIRIQIIALAILLVALSVAARADEVSKAGALKVEVAGFRNNNGKLGCSLFAGPEGFPRDRTNVFRRVWAPIQGGRGECIFNGIPAGDYAVTVFHDENSNGKFDLNWVGYPLEGYGFSNNAKAQFKAPSFDETKFQYDGASVKQISIDMIYR